MIIPFIFIFNVVFYEKYKSNLQSFNLESIRFINKKRIMLYLLLNHILI